MDIFFLENRTPLLLIAGGFIGGCIFEFIVVYLIVHVQRAGHLKKNQVQEACVKEISGLWAEIDSILADQHSRSTSNRIEFGKISSKLQKANALLKTNMQLLEPFYVKYIEVQFKEYGRLIADAGQFQTIPAKDGDVVPAEAAGVPKPLSSIDKPAVSNLDRTVVADFDKTVLTSLDKTVSTSAAFVKDQSKIDVDKTVVLPIETKQPDSSRLEKTVFVAAPELAPKKEPKSPLRTTSGSVGLDLQKTVEINFPSSPFTMPESAPVPDFVGLAPVSTAPLNTIVQQSPIEQKKPITPVQKPLEPMRTFPEEITFEHAQKPEIKTEKDKDASTGIGNFSVKMTAQAPARAAVLSVPVHSAALEKGPGKMNQVETVKENELLSGEDVVKGLDDLFGFGK